MSHLYALHPGNAINAADPEAFAAAQRTIDFRLEHGGAGTGWSRAWMINMEARLGNGKAVLENIRRFFEVSLADNLFDEHPPFQIDGNFGYTAGVAEALLQSHEGFLRLLPALPENWPKGRISGLRARGAIHVDMEWEDGKLQRLGLKAQNPMEIGVRYNEIDTMLKLPARETMWFDGGLKPLEYQPGP